MQLTLEVFLGSMMYASSLLTEVFFSIHTLFLKEADLPTSKT